MREGEDSSFVLLSPEQLMPPPAPLNSTADVGVLESSTQSDRIRGRGSSTLRSVLVDPRLPEADSTSIVRQRSEEIERRRSFWASLHAHLAETSSSFSKFPLFRGHTMDLYSLYTRIQAIGGFEPLKIPVCRCIILRHSTHKRTTQKDGMKEFS